MPAIRTHLLPRRKNASGIGKSWSEYWPDRCFHKAPAKVLWLSPECHILFKTSNGKEKWIVILEITPLIDRVFGKPSAALSVFQVKKYGKGNTKINKGF